MSIEYPMRVKFIYHNVGQGLFYSGEIKHLKSNRIFRFVYDCGSEDTRLINTSVRRFKQDIRNNKIDLLIISHLHSDHVSGLGELFKNNFRIEEVILPYFTPLERLLIALRRINVSEWYYSFLSDPITYLRKEKEVKRVIVIGGGKGTPKKETGNEFYTEELPDDENLKKEIIEHDEDWKKYIEKGDLLVKSHEGWMRVLGLWVFRFFNYKISSSVLQRFKMCLRKNLISITTNKIKEVIKDKEQLRNLKSCYSVIKKSLRDFNNTSLVLYHGPLYELKGKINALYFCPSFHIPYRWFCNILYENINKNFGQLLTGDINLNKKYNELKTHYNDYLNKVSIIQVPHHGARRNWKKCIIKDVPNSKLWVISAGLRNRYGHPSCKVIGDICKNRKTPIWINEMSYITLEGKGNVKIPTINTFAS